MALAFWCFLFCFSMLFARFQILICEPQSIWPKPLVLSWFYLELIRAMRGFEVIVFNPYTPSLKKKSVQISVACTIRLDRCLWMKCKNVLGYDSFFLVIKNDKRIVSNKQKYYAAIAFWEPMHCSSQPVLLAEIALIAV